MYELFHTGTKLFEPSQFCYPLEFPLTISFIMLKNGQTYFENFAVKTPQNF